MAILEREINQDSVPRRRLLSSHEYFALAELGYFDGEHVELIDGEILIMSPMGNKHRGIVSVITQLVVNTFGNGFFTTVQSTYKLDNASVPEPDFGLFAGNARDYIDKPLPTALLVIEVSDSSLDYDRKVKSVIYAKAGIPEYWIVNLVDNKIEVYREPTSAGYSDQTDLEKGQTLSPLFGPETNLSVGDLLP